MHYSEQLAWDVRLFIVVQCEKTFTAPVLKLVHTDPGKSEENPFHCSLIYEHPVRSS